MDNQIILGHSNTAEIDKSSMAEDSLKACSGEDYKEIQEISKTVCSINYP